MAVLATAAMCMGVSFLATALANSLVPMVGPVYGYLAAGGILVFPFLIALLIVYAKLRRAAVPVAPAVGHTVARRLFEAVAREAPWIAASGAAAVAAAEIFLNRNKPPR